jgi:tetratricopeptide (TPR) repeat protein
MPHSRFARAAWLLFLLAEPAAAKELWESEWVEVRTPHFVIASAQDLEKTTELARELEDFRRMVEIFTNIGRLEERIPTKIVLLPRRETDLGFDGKQAGYFQAGMRANYAAMIPMGAFSDEVLKHEYIHFLIHNRDRLLYPTWFDEGFADFFASLRVRGLRFEYGKPMDVRVSWLVNAPWIPYKTVLQARDTSSLGRDRGAMFYAQAFLLVHYLVIEHSDFETRMGEFLKRREHGESPLAAFEAAFGIDPKLLTTKLRRYLRKLPYYKGTLKQPLPPVETTRRVLRPAEIAAELGALALHVQGAEAASKYYEAALAGVGDLHKFAGRFAEAKPYYEKAIALEPENENHELDYAEYFLDLSAKTEEEPARRAQSLLEARRHFMRAYKLNPDNPETLAMNGATYLAEGEDAAKGVESLELAHQLLPSQTTIRLLLAQGYVAAGRPEAARPHLETLLAWTHAGGEEAIRAMLDSLDDGASTTADAAASGAKSVETQPVE